jgi:hypothetical protein
MATTDIREALRIAEQRKALEAARVNRTPGERWLLSRPADNTQCVNVALAMRLGSGSRTARLSVAGGNK